MDRLTGTYKRYSQVWMFCLGLAFAVGFDIDSLRLVGALWEDRTRLEPLVQSLEKWREQHPPKEGAAPKPDTGVLDTINGDQEARQSLEALLAAGLPADVRLPIGWDLDQIGTGTLSTILGRIVEAFTTRTGWLRLVGWLITALAVIPGAQFWFDRLGDALGLRATGRKPPTMRQEGGPPPP